MDVEMLEITPGYGPKFPDTKVNVQHILGWLRGGDADAEILRWFPMLTPAHVQAMRSYFEANKAEVFAKDAELRTYHESERAKQPAWLKERDGWSSERRLAWMRERMEEGKAANHASACITG